MDLWVTALALSDNTTTAVILDVDVQILTNERADQIRNAVGQMTGLPFENIRACATHTHSGPVPYKSWIEKGYEMVEPWFENLARWSAEAAKDAITSLQPVLVQARRGECHINSNRRCVTPSGERFLGVNPDGPCDHEVLVVRLDPISEGEVTRRPGQSQPRVTRPSDEPVATLVNYACHGTVMGPANRLITPDFPGPMKRVVETALGGKCLFLQGAAGDQGPVQGFQADTKVYRDLGAVLGHEVAKVALSLKALPAKQNFREVVPSGAPLGMYKAEFPSMPGAPLQVLEKEIFVPLREGLPDKEAAEKELEFWKARLKAAREQQRSAAVPAASGSGVSPTALGGTPSEPAGADACATLNPITDVEAAITEAIYRARRADIQLRMADDFGGRTSAGVRTHFVTFGDVALVGCNIEPFCEIGLAIKRDSPFPMTCMCGYTDGRMAYMPTAEEWVKGGYEVENSPFGQNAAEALQREVLATLHSLRDNA